MISFLADSSSNIGAGAGVISSLLSLFVSLLMLVSYWKAFEKAGENGYAAIIPFYNTYMICKIAWGNGWLFLIALVAIIPIIGYIIAVVFAFVTMYKFGAAYGKGALFNIGLCVLPVIFLPILAFGKD